jgi:radical SAM superfamily enzyme YgiQ (UPF0313 family)
MRVTLVQPSGFNFIPGQPDFSILANRLAPVGILSLAAWLEQHGHPTAVYDCLGPQAPASLAAQAIQILATQPELVGITATTSGFMDAVELATQLKAARPELRVVVGGPHASSLGAPLLASFPELDALCLGEGEGPLLDLVEGRALADIPNLVWRDGGRIVSNPRRPRFLNLDDLPFPAYEKLAGFPERYHLPLFSYAQRFGATMITSRGCPYTCSFCDRTVFEHQYRFNSPAYIYAHMKHLRDRFGVHHINIYDDLFTANQGRVSELCQRLIDEPLGMNFNCIVRAGHTSEELLRLLKQAGCLLVSFGAESADPGLMARHKAGVTLEAVRCTVEQVHAAGLRAKGLFIFGLPGETPETFQRTSDFILSLDLDDMNLTKFSPLHGAPLWAECVAGEEGDFNEDWRLLNCVNPVFLPKGFASRDQMETLYNGHIERFYKSKAYQRRFGRSLWEHRWSLWHLVRHLPMVWAAKRYFTSKRESDAKAYERHPRQPVGLKPLPLVH